MSTPANAPYKMLQRIARTATEARMVYNSYYGPARAMRDGKLNKKSGRQLATEYRTHH